MSSFNWNPSRAPFFGRFFDSPEQMAMREKMHGAAQEYQAYRPESTQAQLNSLRQVLEMFQPANNQLANMYGPQAQFDTRQSAVNPMSDRMQNVGRPTYEGDNPKYDASRNLFGGSPMTGEIGKGRGPR